MSVQLKWVRLNVVTSYPCHRCLYSLYKEYNIYAHSMVVVVYLVRMRTWYARTMIVCRRSLPKILCWQSLPRCVIGYLIKFWFPRLYNYKEHSILWCVCVCVCGRGDGSSIIRYITSYNMSWCYEDICLKCFPHYKLREPARGRGYPANSFNRPWHNIKEIIINSKDEREYCVGTENLLNLYFKYSYYQRYGMFACHAHLDKQLWL